jgi:glycosyltransferase involved in cell wall biosynthesis
MRGGDIGFNNNMSGIASRVSMEMMALGVPVISYGGDYTPYVAKIWDLDSIAEQVERCWADLMTPGSTVREDTRKYATENYDRAKHVKAYKKLYEDLLGKKNG